MVWQSQDRLNTAFYTLEHIGEAKVGMPVASAAALREPTTMKTGEFREIGIVKSSEGSYFLNDGFGICRRIESVKGEQERINLLMYLASLIVPPVDASFLHEIGDIAFHPELDVIQDKKVPLREYLDSLETNLWGDGQEILNDLEDWKRNQHYGVSRTMREFHVYVDLKGNLRTQKGPGYRISLNDISANTFDNLEDFFEEMPGYVKTLLEGHLYGIWIKSGFAVNRWMEVFHSPSIVFMVDSNNHFYVLEVKKAISAESQRVVSPVN
jgi:hypothetical protein